MSGSHLAQHEAPRKKTRAEAQADVRENEQEYWEDSGYDYDEPESEYESDYDSEYEPERRHRGSGRWKVAVLVVILLVVAAARHGYFAGVLMQVFSTTFYLVTVYIVKEFFRTFFAASLSQLLTIAAFSALYYVMQYFIFPGQNAFAGSDLLEQYCMGAFGAGGCVSALVKKACLIMVSGALLVGARKRGDILA